MDQKEINEIFLQQINDRNKIIDKLLEERKNERRINWISLIKDSFLFIIILFMIYGYFFVYWDSATTSNTDTTNYNENINRNINEGGDR